MEPGEYFLGDEEIEINVGCRTLKLEVRNTGDRAIQVGSHYHFFEVNRALDFDRAPAMGMRLNIIAGTTLRFEPGDTREVELVEYTGRRRAVGFNGLVNGSATSAAQVRPALERAWLLGFKGARAPEARDDTPREETSREETSREKTPRERKPRDGRRGGR